MAKQRAKNTDPIALGRIEFGEIVDGKNVVRSFEPGDVVDLPTAKIEEFIKLGAVAQLAPETPQVPDAAAVREAFIADAKKTYENTPALKKEFADFDAYLAALDKAA
jgi:hypothetical protein